jgi:hypothetical protein
MMFMMATGDLDVHSIPDGSADCDVRLCWRDIWIVCGARDGLDYCCQKFHDSLDDCYVSGVHDDLEDCDVRESMMKLMTVM